MRLSPALSKSLEHWRCTVACPPVMLGLVGCGLLFLARMRGALDALSANAEVPGYDFFGLPRAILKCCGSEIGTPA